MIVSLRILLRARSDSDKSCVENQKFLMCSNVFPEIRTLYENVEKYSTVRQATDDTCAFRAV
jgi:hypothetical protein